MLLSKTGISKRFEVMIVAGGAKSMPLIPALRRQDRYEYEASLFYILSSRIARATW